MKAKVVGVAILLLVAVGFASSRLRPVDNQLSPKHPRRTSTPEVPTPVQEGVMSEKQKHHSKLFGEYKTDVTRGKTLHQLVSEKGDVQVGRGIGNVRLPNSFDLDQHLAKVFCQADAVVIGTIKDKSSNLVEDGSFTFTDYNLLIDEILKDNSRTHLESNSSITIVRASGAVMLLGHVVRAIDYSQEPLSIGDKYLLFLRFVPVTGAYRSLGSPVADDSFDLEDDQVSQVSSQPLPFGPNRSADANSFLATVRAMSKKGCMK